MDSELRDVKKYESRVSRRAFLRAAGSGMLLTSATAAAISFTESTAYARKKWDREADIVVVGSGAAGSSAALFARESGANVLMLEKAAIYGGTTAKSGGVCWIPNNFLMREKGLEDPREDCIRYMARTAYPTLYSVKDSRFGLPESTYDLLVAYYDNASPTIDALRTIGVDPFTEWLAFDGKGTPDYWAHLPENKAAYGRAIKPANPDGTGGSGALLIAKLKAAIEKRRIPVLMEHRANRLVLNSKGEVIGIEARTGEDHTVTVRAHKGVIFGSGGFTSNPDLSLNFLRGPIFGGCAVPTNEGDFVYIGAGAGAKLANMNNAWWSQVNLEQALQSRSVPTSVGYPPGDSMILVNRFGRRCVNETVQYNERTQSHFLWDPHSAAYPNLVQFMIYDQPCREHFANSDQQRHRIGGAGLILKPGISAPYVLTGQSLEDLGRLIDDRLTQISDKTGGLRLDPGFSATLRETISRFNQFAETGRDLDFHRGETPIELAEFGPGRTGNDKPNKTMYPFSATGPFYAVMLGGGTFDTKGGPKINAQAQVVDGNDKPIPGLYGAGNCIAAPAGQGYWAGGTTIGPALTFGAIAAKTAAKEPIKELA